MINYAHRGASEYAPENTLAACYMGVEMGANGIETDVRRTADGKLVLFHDDTMQRVAGRTEAVEQLSYTELLGIDVGSYKGAKYKNERIVLLEDFLKYFGGKDIQLAIELKGQDIEWDTLELLHRMTNLNNVIVTSFHLQYLLNIREHDKSISLGYLTTEFTRGVMQQLNQAGIGQICPAAKDLTPKLVTDAKARGFTVRSWGVANVELMEHSCTCGVDGMTVNFPDKLAMLLRDK